MINNAILGVIAGQRITSAPGGDPYWANVVALLRFDGSNGSGAFIDETGKTWTKTGSPTITTSTAVFGQSGVFTSTQALNSPVSADFSWGTGDYTVEGWFRTSNTVTHYFIGNSIPSINPPIWYWLRHSGGGLRVHLGATTHNCDPMPLNTWQHIAVSRSSGTFHIYQNFVRKITGSDPTNYNSVAERKMQLGTVTSGFSGLAGQVDEFRVTKGVGRYSTATIPTQTAPWPNF